MKTVTRDDFPPHLAGLVDLVGLEAAVKIVEHWGGSRLHLCGLERLHRSARDRSIRNAHAAGAAPENLAEVHGVSEALIRSILSRGTDER